MTVINRDKIKVMKFRIEGTLKNRHIHLRGTRTGNSQKLEYLGIMFQVTGHLL
jgi:hypothetical protein